MPTVAVMVLLAMWSLISPVANAGVEPSLLRQSDETTGTLSPLGDGNATYSDAHGNQRPMHRGSGFPAHSFSAPHGATPSTITPFGTPTPPNLLTPAPLLPLQPKGMAIPQPQAPTVPHAPGLFGPSDGRPGH